MFENPHKKNETVEGADAEIEAEAAALDIETGKLEQALASIGGAEGLQAVLDEVPDTAKQDIFARLAEEHDLKMWQIARDQEKAGKLMDEGLRFMWDPKFIYEQGIKNKHDSGSSALLTALLMGSGSSIVTGFGASLVGTAKHFSSRISEKLEERRYQIALNAATE